MDASDNETLPSARHGQNDPAMALQRKNALFAGHELGAENWAAIASLIETCKLGAINPAAYLADVLARIVTRGDGEPIDDLLPGNWVDTRSEEHTSELQSLMRNSYAVFCLKKKK